MDFINNQLFQNTKRAKQNFDRKAKIIMSLITHINTSEKNRNTGWER